MKLRLCLGLHDYILCMTKYFMSHQLNVAFENNLLWPLCINTWDIESTPAFIIVRKCLVLLDFARGADRLACRGNPTSLQLNSDVIQLSSDCNFLAICSIQICWKCSLTEKLQQYHDHITIYFLKKAFEKAGFKVENERVSTVQTKQICEKPIICKKCDKQNGNYTKGE